MTKYHSQIMLKSKHLYCPIEDTENLKAVRRDTLLVEEQKNKKSSTMKLIFHFRNHSGQKEVP
jgi:hypothetical protein